MESIKRIPAWNTAISPKQSTDRGGRAPTVESNKRQASGDKRQATSFKRQAKRQATSAECGPNRQATGKAFRGDRL